MSEPFDVDAYLERLQQEDERRRAFLQREREAYDGATEEERAAWGAYCQRCHDKDAAAYMRDGSARNPATLAHWSPPLTFTQWRTRGEDRLVAAIFSDNDASETLRKDTEERQGMTVRITLAVGAFIDSIRGKTHL